MSKSGIVAQPVQWAGLTHIDDIEPIGEADRAVLEEIRDVILRHGYTDRFGICLLHRHFDIDPDEVLVETTDVDKRVSSIEVGRRDDTPSDRFIETMWHFKSDKAKAGTECRLMCDYAGGHKRVHRKVAV